MQINGPSIRPKRRKTSPHTPCITRPKIARKRWVTASCDSTSNSWRRSSIPWRERFRAMRNPSFTMNKWKNSIFWKKPTLSISKLLEAKHIILGSQGGTWEFPNNMMSKVNRFAFSIGKPTVLGYSNFETDPYFTFLEHKNTHDDVWATHVVIEWRWWYHSILDVQSRNHSVVMWLPLLKRLDIVKWVTLL